MGGGRIFWGGQRGGPIFFPVGQRGGPEFFEGQKGGTKNFSQKCSRLRRKLLLHNIVLSRPGGTRIFFM